MLLSCILSALFLIWSAILVKSNIDKHRKTVCKDATQMMSDLFTRILCYGFGVLFTLSILVATGFNFWINHAKIRNGLTGWLECSLTNYFTELAAKAQGIPPEALALRDCDSERPNDEKIQPFWFMSWNIACLIAIIAQIILSFHTKARERAVLIKQRTIGKIQDVVSDVVSEIHSPKSSRSKNSKERPSKLNIKGAVEIGFPFDYDSPRTTTTSGISYVINPSRQLSGDNGDPITPIDTKSGDNNGDEKGDNDMLLHTIEMQQKPRSQSREEFFMQRAKSQGSALTNSTNHDDVTYDDREEERNFQD